MNFGRKIGVFLGLGQKAQINADPCIFEALIDEASVPAFITREEFEQLLYVRVLGAPRNLGIKHAAGKLRRHRAYQKIGEFARAVPALALQ